jgi:peptide chain release factor 3
LQFEVLQYRLETEYNAETRRESAPFTTVRWLPQGTPTEALDTLSLPTGARLAFDVDSNPVALFPSEWSLGYFSQNHPSLTLTSLAPPRVHTR